MLKGDNVLINYGNNIRKLATFLEKEDKKNYFQDISGLFVLTDNFISENKIKITIIEEF